WAYSTTSGSIRTKTFGSLTPGTNYQFYVKSANKWGYGPSTSTLSTVVLSAPDAPTNVTGTPNDGEVTLTWSAPINTGGSAITSYTATAVQDGTKTCTTATLTCTITGLTNGTSYTFTISATNIAGTSVPSSPSSAVIPATAPNAPTGVNGVPGNGQVTLTWSAPLNTGGSPITSYTATASPGGAACTTATLTCTITGLTNGISYTFSATGTSGHFTSTPSNASQPVTPFPRPDPPRITKLTLISTSAIVDWSSPQSQVTSGGDHTCALATTGSINCWGGNYEGQLGDGTNINSSSPVAVLGLNYGVSAIAAGQYHACALTNTGGVECWGNNVYGQLGNGTQTPATAPVSVSGLASGVRAIAAGATQTCALMITGGVKCWGQGNGTGTAYSTSLIPVDVTGLTSGVSGIAAGFNNTCALLTTGGIKCWGSNNLGQLGDGTNIDSSTPVAVIGLGLPASAVTVGGGQACGLLNNGGVKCWGANNVGQLGDGTGVKSYTPVYVNGLTTGVSAISAGNSHTCALISAGGIKCWGANYHGALGNGTMMKSYIPVDVVGIDGVGLSSSVSAIAAGQDHTCALFMGGGIECWGYNGFGQLGNGSSSDGLAPANLRDIPGDLGTSYTTTSVQDPTKSCTVTAPATECNIDGLTIGQTYTFTVTATNAIGTSSPSVPSDPITIF
ncbi:MAG: fibronectin type III domain-containing protein, partial [Actinomycetes bacterium]